MDPMRYLLERKGHWHYQRRVPKRATAFDERTFVRRGLDTISLEVAKTRRDAHERADDLYWAGLAGGDSVDGQTKMYEAAIARANNLGFVYRAAEEMAESATTRDLVQRLRAAAGKPALERRAATGLIDRPELSVTDAMALYVSTIGVEQVRGHSPKQIKSWTKVKNRARDNFIRVVGDKPVLKIDRDDAQKFWAFWSKRVSAGEVKGNTANRDLGNMRKLFREYAVWLNLDMKNPFDDLSFRDRRIDKADIPPFEADWIRTNILIPGALTMLNEQARLICLALIETGCRPSELCNLSPERIHLDKPVPYLSIEFVEGRSLKSESSIREIPLVGVSLAAMQRAPNGFPRYRDKEDNLSATLMKCFRVQNLLPTERHRIYSFRHGFEKRMLEAGLTFDFRCKIMGHAIERPAYSDGGSMEWRREQLETIAIPYETGLFGVDSG